MKFQEPMRVMPKGSYIAVACGEYSDYYIRGFYLACEDVDPNILKDEYIALNPEAIEDYKFDGLDFVKFIEDKNLVKKLPYYEFHTDSYSNLKEMWVYDNAMFLGNNAGVNTIN